MLYPKPAHLSNRPIQDFDSSCSDTEIEESSGQASDGIRGDGSDGGSGLASAVPTGGSLDSGESDGRMVSISDDEDDHDRDSMDPTLNFIPEVPDSQPLPEEPSVPLDSVEPTIDEPVQDDELGPSASEPSESECEYDKYRPEDKAIPFERVPKSPPKKCKNKEEEIKKLVALVANLKKERTALTLNRC